MKFEWDDRKNCLNREKHGCDFADVPEMFLSNRFEMQDDRRDYGDPRIIVIGNINSRIMVGVFTMRGTDTIRIISLRKANSREKAKFKRALAHRLGSG
ncbi:BrnT family toxin [Geomonas propionica]|uniref:BrnT family toxin n=1 Tax=Geomonas propionica TaxID=2798582 RepID=A0ABS0YUQ5_9BACT|nr:BrnT family toxin [Geomonas propionica]MBJ6801608.1 BrnT family toxin [Geomonas propionica]